VTEGPAARPPLVIGLVNSMPGEALEHTERQFRAILAAASGGRGVRIRLFSLEPPPAATAFRYEHAARIDPAALDGLIVTGMPPRAATLPDEPSWSALTALVDVAAGQAIPTVWSCLAAHAAVLHMDGIARRRLPDKLSGLYDCMRERDNPLLVGLPRRWRVPHSRYNGLPAEALAARGYDILSASPEAGVDLFAREAGAPFLFCQGHPEYDAHALLREYRRDIRQFLTGAREAYPAMPRGCFSPGVASLLDAFRAAAMRERTPALLARFPLAACEADLTHSWRGVANRLYTNWLAQVAAQKACRAGAVTAPPPARPRHAAAPAGAPPA
jgi:homoserine O-succinyltransferase